MENKEELMDRRSLDVEGIKSSPSIMKRKGLRFKKFDLKNDVGERKKKKRRKTKN
jgi:hypothetical protein